MELLSCSISIGLVDVIMVVLYEPGVEVSFMINSTIFGQFSKRMFCFDGVFTLRLSGVYLSPKPET